MTARASWIEIDTEAAAENARAILRAIGPGVRLYACLKGDAYGCGIRIVAPRLARLGIRHFAVGSVDDAVAIRQADVAGEILLYPNCLPDAIDVVESQELTVTVNSVEEAQAWNAAATRPLPVFVKVDVGALRGGCLPRAAGALGRAIAALDRLQVVGAYAHLHLPDPLGMRAHALHQLHRFDQGVSALRAASIEIRTRMVSGTAALMGFPEMDLEAVDPGRALFGLGFPGTARELRLRPVVRRWVCRLLLVKDATPEDVAPFSAPFPVERPMRIGLIPLGWGDGLPRRMSPAMRVLVRGRRVPLLPPSHFEHVRIDLTDVPSARYGDEVVVLGAQQGDRIELAEAAEWVGRDDLAFIGSLPRHVPRIAVTDEPKT
jgi:alanine racemase